MSFSDSCMRPGTLVVDELRELVTTGAVYSNAGIADAQVQPASIDLTLADEAYRLPGSVLPLAGETVRDLVKHLALERLDLSTPTCLGRDQVYLVRLRERFRLPPGMEAYTNSKSSTGRVDLATRVLADGSPRYDRIPSGYDGDLWLELIPRSFNVVAQVGVSLNQAIFFCQRIVLSQAEMLERHARQPLLREPDGRASASRACLFDGRAVMTADLSQPIVGYVAKRTHHPLVLAKVRGHHTDDFFAPVPKPPSGFLFLEQERFYILATRERVVVPADLACEMVPYDASAGEFRAHYAGFFDPGWGISGDQEPGAKAVLEVRPHQDDLILRHGQPICAMAYEVLQRPCTRLYGTCSNTYAGQDGPTLSKHFVVAS
ncbi:MAG: 2'-deoxycytidine 5'-triphosphate deaminase [Planctomycetes bacterium]|nr:2'-deoxycytidine 5'-triphosphate deaminase [Planctomycetota bacterium]